MTKSTITRERLEALANAEYCKSNPGAWLLGLREVNELARMALAALDSEPVPVVMDGYVMVPKEPTDEMIAAAMNCEDVLFNSDDSFCVQFRNIYEAMLAAAPQEVK